MPASKIKKPIINIQENKMLSDILYILYGSTEINSEVKINSYDHCETIEELEFDLFTDLVQSGMSAERASEMSKEIAKELWEHSTEK